MGWYRGSLLEKEKSRWTIKKQLANKQALPVRVISKRMFTNSIYFQNVLQTKHVTKQTLQSSLKPPNKTSTIYMYDINKVPGYLDRDNCDYTITLNICNAWTMNVYKPPSMYLGTA